MAGNKSLVLSILGNNSKARESIAQVDEELDGVKAKAGDIFVKADTAPAIGPITELDDALEKYKVAATEAADAQERLSKLQKDGQASASELAYAQKAAADSTKALKDAQLSLGKAELNSSDEARVAAAKQEELAAKTRLSGESAKESKGHWSLLALGLVGAGVVMVDVASKFQTANTHLVTDAGESGKAMDAVAKGMLEISASTGVSAEEISKAMFTVESAGFHYANGGLVVMRAVAQGAKATGTDVSDMANAVTSALNAYGLHADKAANVTSQLIATVSAGKMHMQDLAVALSNVLPIASAAGISLGQVGGAMATMTSMGMSADQASQNLANAVRNLIHPNAVASAEMMRLGLNVIDVEKHVGQRGLTGTLQMLTEAILRNSQGGSVIAGTYAHMTAETKGYAEQILAGATSSKVLAKETKNLTPLQHHLLAAFKSLAVSATGIKQSYAGAMAAMTGGATGLNVALMLTGKHMSTFKANAAGISEAGKSGKALADDWAMSSQNLSTQVDIAKTSVVDLGISVGLKLLPPVTALIKPIAAVLSALVSLPGAGPAIIVLGFTFLALWAAVKVGNGAKEMFEGISGALGGFKNALFGVTEAEGEAKVGQLELNFAIFSSPIFWIIAGLVLVGVAFYELWKHCAAFRNFWKEAWHDILMAFDHSRRWIATAFDDVRHTIAAFTHDFSAYFAEIRGNIHRWYSDVVNFGGRVISWFGQLPSRIWGYLVDFGKLLGNAGKSLIDGLISGVENEAGRLWSYIGNIGGQISSVFKSALSIFSPSRVFMEHGKNIVLGLVGGIDGYAHLAELSVSRLAQRAISASGGKFNGASGSGGGGVLQLEWVGGAGAEQEIMTLLKKWIRIRGGDPNVLGR